MRGGLNLKKEAIKMNENVQQEIRELQEKLFNNRKKDGMQSEIATVHMDTLEYLLKKNTEQIEYIQDTANILIDYDGCLTVESLKELIDETRERLSLFLNHKI